MLKNVKHELDKSSNKEKADAAKKQQSIKK